MHQHRILTYIPVIRGQDVLGTLVQNPVQYQPVRPPLFRHIECHAIGTGVQVHLMQVLMDIQIRHDPAAVRIVLEVIDYPVSLVEHPFFIHMLYPHLITVGFSDRTRLIRPAIPDMALKLMNIIRFLLPDPQHLIRTALNRSPPKRQRRKFLRQIITIHYPEPLNGISRAPVFPLRADLLPAGIRSMIYNIPAHLYKDSVSVTHNFLLHLPLKIPAIPFYRLSL